MFPLRPYVAKLAQKIGRLTHQILWICIKIAFLCLFSQFSVYATDFDARTLQIMYNFDNLAQAQNLSRNTALEFSISLNDKLKNKNNKNLNIKWITKINEIKMHFNILQISHCQTCISERCLGVTKHWILKTNWWSTLHKLTAKGCLLCQFKQTLTEQMKWSVHQNAQAVFTTTVF